MLSALVSRPQPLWEHTDISINVLDNLTSSTMYTDITKLPGGDLLLTGRVDDCYYPFVSRISPAGEIIQRTYLQIGRTNYGYINEIIPLPNGKMIAVSWGATADDVGGSNGFVTIVNSQLEIEGLDSVKSYSGYAPGGFISSADGWLHGDTLTAVFGSEGSMSDTLVVRQYRADSLLLLRSTTFLLPPGAFDDLPVQGIGLSPDTLVIASGQRLFRLVWNQKSPVDTFTAAGNILSLSQQGGDILAITACKGYRLSAGYAVKQSHTWPACMQRAFFLANAHSSIVGLAVNDTTYYYRWAAQGIPQQLYMQTEKGRRAMAGYRVSDSLWYAVGQNRVNAAGWAIDPTGQRMPAQDDLALVDMQVTETVIDSAPLFNDWEYQYAYAFSFTVENLSGTPVDSFAIWNSSGIQWGMNCSSTILGDTFYHTLAPGSRATVHMAYAVWGWGARLKGKLCFRAEGPNGRIDENKTNNSACSQVLITGIPKKPMETAHIWTDPASGRVHLSIQQPEGFFTLQNMQGQEVLRRRITQKVTQWALALPAGIYVGIISDDTGRPVARQPIFIR